jgi:hypothetical protein
MRRAAFALLAAAAFAAPSAIAQGAGAPAALMQAIAATQSARVAYAFDIELTSSRMNWRARFEPGADPPMRLVAPARDELEGGARRAFDRFARDTEGVSWCANPYMGRIADVRLVSEDATTATYAFQPTRESIRSEESRRYAQHMRGEMTMTKADADITRIRIFAPQRFDPAPLVRLDHMNIVMRCIPAPNGRRYVTESITEMRGSAFGQAFNERTVQRTTNLSAP